MKSAKHILLVEDNPGDVLLIRQHLDALTEKYELTIADDGEKAINLLSSFTDMSKMPQLILLDLNLPKRSGIDVLSNIKTNEQLKSIPVIMLTSSSLREDIEKAYNALANSYIVKPFDFDEFSLVIRNLWQFWFGTASLPEIGVQ